MLVSGARAFSSILPRVRLSAAAIAEFSSHEDHVNA